METNLGVATASTKPACSMLRFWFRFGARGPTLIAPDSHRLAAAAAGRRSLACHEKKGCSANRGLSWVSCWPPHTIGPKKLLVPSF